MHKHKPTWPPHPHATLTSSPCMTASSTRSALSAGLSASNLGMMTVLRMIRASLRLLFSLEDGRAGSATAGQILMDRQSHVRAL